MEEWIFQKRNGNLNNFKNDFFDATKEWNLVFQV